MKIQFVKFNTTDGRIIAVSIMHVQAIEEHGNTISVLLGGKWLDLDVTLDEFVASYNLE